MRSILVIDDEEMIRSLLVTMLTRSGFNVEEASDGQAGMALFHKHPTDLVITDVFMPNKDGIEVVMQLKDSYPNLKIIAMTGGGQTGMVQIGSAAKMLGAEYVLHKPFENGSLLATVNLALDSTRP